ncbi:hypothetical protein BGX26_011252 [Mortierella sp. AD094]|nr:hypothetical protein BGX26_011252 [Mortierella sp. AD094]
MSQGKTHPLLLPELLLSVSQFVDPVDVLDCIAVCKAWRNAFSPLLWTNVTINQHEPPRKSIEENIRRIHKLVYSESVPSEYYMSIQCPNLKTFKVVEQGRPFMSNPLWSKVSDFIKENPTLVSIQLSANVATKLPIGIWDAINESTSVKALRLDKVRIDAVQTESFWGACTVLEKLELNSCQVSDPWAEAHILPASLPLLQEITFTTLEGIGELGQLHLVALCPNLRSLYWSGSSFPIRELTSSQFTGGPLLYLDSLDVLGEVPRGNIDYFLANNATPLKKLAIPGSWYDPLTAEKLERHFLTLQELDLTRHPHVDSKLALTVLSKCEVLTSFKTGVISATDISWKESWKCADRLLTLHVYFDMGKLHHGAMSRQVFDCLSKLTSLQELNLAKRGGSVGNNRQKAQPIKLELDCGMDLLSTLRHMKRFYFGENHPGMTMKEANWIKENWPMLETIQGKFNEDPDLNAQIQELFLRENERFSRLFMSLRKTHPLLLPELLFSLSYYVDPVDVLDCSFVCKAWYDAFSPMVWSTVTIDSPYWSPLVLIQAIKSNIRHIRKLAYLRGVPPEFLSIQYPNLETLKVVEDEWTIADNPLWSGVAKFINENPTLVTIQLSANITTRLPIGVWDAIKESTSVKVLRLDKIRIDALQTEAFWRACTVLEKLELNCCAVSDPWAEVGIDSSLLPASFPLIQEIKFTNLEGVGELKQLCLVAMCPNLRSLSWSGDDFPISQFALSGNPILNLDSLEARGEHIYRGIEYFLIHNRGPLKRLSISDSIIFGGVRYLSSSSEKILERHFLTLQEVDLTWHSDVNTTTMIVLLRSCPLLTSFKAGAFDPKYLCRDEAIRASADRLLTLHIYFKIESYQADVKSDLVCEYLSNLTALQELNLVKCKLLASTSSKGQPETRPLRLRLDCGLHRLRWLKDMRRFYFEKQGQGMTMEEAMWMKEHWKKLESVQGGFHKSKKMNAQIQELFCNENERFLRRQLRENK